MLVTGDVSYHTALDARAEGVALLDLGHSPSERVATQVIHETLCGWAKRNGVTLDVETFWEREPFSALGV